MNEHKIMLVDDEPDILDLLEKALNIEGFHNITKIDNGIFAVIACKEIQPDIIILDEATSNIDTETEKLIQKMFSTVLKGKTSFVIAHRLSTIKNADRILYVDDNGILEDGSHEELMQKKGLYYGLVQKG